jgi:glycosyltransferase involved in cell wall biosynthesis
LNYLSFSKKGRKKVRKLQGDFDVVFLNGLSPIMQCEPGLSYALAHRKKTLLYCLDLWPISLTARGLENQGFTKPIYRYFLKKSKLIYQSIDRILISSPAYAPYFSDILNVSRERVSVLPQFAEDLFLQIGSYHPEQTSIFHFLFAGNVGKVQDVETLVRTAEHFKGNPNLVFQVAGDGSDLKKVKKIAIKKGVSNIQFLGRLPLNQMKNLYDQTDGFILTLSKKELTSYVIPGKTQSYLAAGRAIFGAADGAVADLIKESRAGFAVASGDDLALARAINSFIQLPINEKKAFGENGRGFYLAHFSRDSFFETLLGELRKLC